jgi:hypothetical protein
VYARGLKTHSNLLLPQFSIYPTSTLNHGDMPRMCLRVNHITPEQCSPYYLLLRFFNDFRDLDAERDRDCEPDLDEPELESDDDDDDDDELRELELELLLLEVECLRRFRDLNISHSVYYPSCYPTYSKCTEYKQANTTISDNTDKCDITLQLPHVKHTYTQKQ